MTGKLRDVGTKFANWKVGYTDLCTNNTASTLRIVKVQATKLVVRDNQFAQEGIAFEVGPIFVTSEGELVDFLESRVPGVIETYERPLAVAHEMMED